MRLETFTGNSLSDCMRALRKEMGDDAMIVRTRQFRRAGGPRVEVVAARSEEVETLRRRLDGSRAAAERARTRQRVGPYVVALVGPAGAGKTTSAVKLALNPRGVAKKKVGILSLDTHRVAGLEEIQTFAEIANLPLEVVYHRREVPEAMKRLRSCDVVIVDCPGRTPSHTAQVPEWQEALELLEPDEVHLVLPAGLRWEVACDIRDTFRPVGTTHVLFTQLDHLHMDRGLAQLAERVGLPTRWVADGHEIPGDLKEAAPRILAALGLGENETRERRAS